MGRPGTGRTAVIGRFDEDDLGSILQHWPPPRWPVIWSSPTRRSRFARRRLVHAGSGRSERNEATRQSLASLGAIVERTRRGVWPGPGGWHHGRRLARLRHPEQRRSARDSFRD
ncbi:MAG TPA: hypothetical protein VFA45_15135 [Actinomycetes bacterium]|nr:hypothetical protein [Actinomycetes bacterium]